MQFFVNLDTLYAKQPLNESQGEQRAAIKRVRD